MSETVLVAIFKRDRLYHRPHPQAPNAALCGAGLCGGFKKAALIRAGWQPCAHCELIATAKASQESTPDEED